MFSYVPLANKLRAAIGPQEIVDHASTTTTIESRAVTSWSESARIKRRLSTEPVLSWRPVRFLRRFNEALSNRKAACVQGESFKAQRHQAVRAVTLESRTIYRLKKGGIPKRGSLLIHDGTGTLSSSVFKTCDARCRCPSLSMPRHTILWASTGITICLMSSGMT